MGIKQDAEFGVSSLTPQSAYTPYVQAIKSHSSTFARDGSDYVSNVDFRKEAQVQGVSTVKVWDCSLQCYDARFISTGGSAVEGQYVWLSFLPFEDKGHNAELDNFLQYDKKPDAFGAQAWVAGQIFATAVNVGGCEERTERPDPLGAAHRDPGHHELRRQRLHLADQHRRQDRQQMPDRDAGTERQVRARRSSRAGQVRLHRQCDERSPSTRSRPTRASRRRAPSRRHHEHCRAVDAVVREVSERFVRVVERRTASPRPRYVCRRRSAGRRCRRRACWR